MRLLLGASYVAGLFKRLAKGERCKLTIKSISSSHSHISPPLGIKHRLLCFSVDESWECGIVHMAAACPPRACYKALNLLDRRSSPIRNMWPSVLGAGASMPLSWDLRSSSSRRSRYLRGLSLRRTPRIRRRWCCCSTSSFSSCAAVRDQQCEAYSSAVETTHQAGLRIASSPRIWRSSAYGLQCWYSCFRPIYWAHHWPKCISAQTLFSVPYQKIINHVKRLLGGFL